MLTYLGQLGEDIQVFNVFRYITFSTGAATMTALLFVFLFGPGIIEALKIRQGKGQPIRADGPQTHLCQGRHADDGRADDPVGRARLDAALGQSLQHLRLGGAARDHRLRR